MCSALVSIGDQHHECCRIRVHVMGWYWHACGGIGVDGLCVGCCGCACIEVTQICMCDIGSCVVVGAPMSIYMCVVLVVTVYVLVVYYIVCVGTDTLCICAYMRGLQYV